jgi:hypothetical protein
MGPELATGLFTLGGVIVGAGASTWGQVYLESKREKREADRAKRMVAGELLHLQLVLRAAAVGPEWPLVRDVNAQRAERGAAGVSLSPGRHGGRRLVQPTRDDVRGARGHPSAVRHGLRPRRQAARGFRRDKSDALVVQAGPLAQNARRHRGGWPDEIVEDTVASFMQIFDRLSDDDLNNESQVARVKDIANSLAPLKHDGDAWLAEINRRLERVNPDQQ